MENSIEVTQRFYVDPFVQTVVEVGCMAACECHSLHIEKWIDCLEEDTTIFYWNFLEGKELHFFDRFKRAYRYVFKYKKWINYCDSTLVTYNQMRRLHDLLRKVAVPQLDFDQVQPIVDQNKIVMSADGEDDIKLIITRMNDEDSYEIGYIRNELTPFKDRLEMAVSYVLWDSKWHELCTTQCMLSELDMDCLLKRIDIDLKQIEHNGG